MDDSIRLTNIRDLIRGAVNDYIDNKKLRKETKAEFAKKGFNVNTPNLLWSNAINIDDLNKFELIAISKSIYKVLGDDNFKLKNNFSIGDIEDYNNLINQEKIIDNIFLKNVTQIDEKNYHCIITAEQLYNIRKNSLVGYYRQYQRAGIEYKTATGRILEKMGINTSGVIDMQGRFLEKLKDKNERKTPDIKPTSLAFTVLLNELTDLSENFVFQALYENIGNLYIKPDYDAENESGVRVTCSDGMHRYIALTNAFEIAKNNNQYLDEKMGLYIHLMTHNEATQFQYDIFQRNDTDLDYIKSMKVSEDTDFVYKFEKDSKWLNNHVAPTKKALRLDKNFIQQDTIIEAFKNTDIPMKSDTNTAITREKIAKIIDDLLDYVLCDIYDNNEVDFKNSIYFKENMFILYIKFAATVRKTRYTKLIVDFVTHIEVEKAKMELKLNGRADEMYKYFNDTIKEVVK